MGDMSSNPENSDEPGLKEINLDTPDPPDDLPYADFEDYRAEELLKINGFSLTVEALLTVLDNSDAVLKGAAAHTLGRLGATAAVASLRRLTDASNDLVKVEA